MKSPIGRRVLMTGGTGFLGRAILERAEREEWDAQFTIYSRDEMKQFTARSRWPNTNCILGDITDTVRLTTAITGHDTVLHLAAHKFVPEAERDVSVAIKANIEGTKAVADACAMARPDNAIFISTDKASDPVNLYGMTKAVGERIWGEARRTSRHTKFAATRYGNVIGSTGSVLPHFVNQIRRGEQLSLTSLEMSRFLMPVEESIDAIIAAYNTDEFMTIPSPKSASLEDMARAAFMIAHISHPNVFPSNEQKWRVTGIRPGEKLHETLISEREQYLVRAWIAPHYFLAPEYENSYAIQYKNARAISSNSSSTHRLSAKEIADYYMKVATL